VTDFAAAMRKIITSPGVDRPTLSILAAGILGIAARPESQMTAEAARVARETMFSAADWQPALDRIGDRPHRAELIRVIADASSHTHTAPDRIARELLGDETHPGLLSPYIPNPPQKENLTR
jgi:hypothetical protein